MSTAVSLHFSCPSKMACWTRSPYLPDVPVPTSACEAHNGDDEGTASWRRYAFERSHRTSLEPHRPSGNTWQVLVRIGFWRTMRRDFEKWIHGCGVCHQFRTVGAMPPMRSTLGSTPAFKKLPWSDVIIDCLGPFTPSIRGNQYVVSYHCCVLGIPKVEPFED